MVTRSDPFAMLSRQAMLAAASAEQGHLSTSRSRARTERAERSESGPVAASPATTGAAQVPEATPGQAPSSAAGVALRGERDTQPHDGVRIVFLGPVRIESADSVCEIKDKKAILLLFLLAVRGASSRQQSASLLWPATDSERSQGSLRLRIHKLNRLCPGLIQSHLTSIFLRPGIAHDIGFLTGSEDIPLEVALKAHRGHLIGSLEFAENPQLNAIITHYRQQFVTKASTLLERLARECAEARDYRQATDYLSQILLLTPHDEAVCRHLMRVHVLSGRRAAAIETYEAFRRNMRESLGIEPDARTKRLHMDILLLQHEPDSSSGALSEQD